MNRGFIFLFVLMHFLLAQPTAFFSKEKEAEKFFEAGRYEKALPLYQQLLETEKNEEKKTKYLEKVYTLYKITHQYKTALDYCQKYLEQNSKDTLAQMEYADLLKINNQAEKALEVYASMLAEKPRNVAIRKRYDQTRWVILQQDSMREAKIQKTNFVMQDNLGFSIKKDSLFASALVQSPKEKNSTFYQIHRFFFKDSLQIDTSTQKNFLGKIGENFLNTGATSFNKTGDEVYFTALENKTSFRGESKKNPNKNQNNLKILYSKLQADSSWSVPMPMDFCTPTYNYTHPHLSFDGKRLFFVSDQDNKWGNYDIFMAKKTGDTWGTPRKLSNKVNSERTEMFPFLYKEYLFFSSFGREGFGAADLFRSKMNGDQFEEAENLGQPINSSYDDFGIFFTDTLQNKGYFVSNRENPKGADELFFVHVLGDFQLIEKPMDDSTKNASEQRKLFLAVLDKKSLGEVETEIQIFEKQGKDSILVVSQKDEAGKTFVTLDKNKNYSAAIQNSESGEKLTISSLEKFPSNELLVFVDDPNQPQLALTEAQVKSFSPYTPKIEEKLFFEFDRFNVLELEKIKLKKSIQVLKENPDLMIVLEGHTDSRGADWYNDNLSRRRVVKVMEYLRLQGVHKDQIVFAFFGKRRLASQEDEGKNRRVESRMVYKK